MGIVYTAFTPAIVSRITRLQRAWSTLLRYEPCCDMHAHACEAKLAELDAVLTSLEQEGWE